MQQTKKKQGRPATGRKGGATITIAVPENMKFILDNVYKRKKNALIVRLLEKHFAENKAEMIVKTIRKNQILKYCDFISLKN